MTKIKIDPEKVIKVPPKAGKEDYNKLKVDPKTGEYTLLHVDYLSHPDPKLHQTVSFLKSAVRISGYVALFWSIGLAATILIISELIGIIEELV